MKNLNLILVTLILIASQNSWTANCEGETKDCYDAGSQSWVTFQNADTCSDYIDAQTGKWTTTAYCGKTSYPPPHGCAGETKDCFDAESQSWITFTNADSCSDYFDAQSQKWKTIPYCSK